jgi:hypothetical protein
MTLAWFGRGDAKQAKQTERERFAAKLRVRRGLSTVRFTSTVVRSIPVLTASAFVAATTSTAARIPAFG